MLVLALLYEGVNAGMRVYQKHYLVSGIAIFSALFWMALWLVVRFCRQTSRLIF
jgi:hypothetical protein